MVVSTWSDLICTNHVINMNLKFLSDSRLHCGRYDKNYKNVHVYIVSIFLLISHLKKERLVFRFNLTQMIRVVSNNRTRKVISSNFKKGFRSAENLIALLNLLLRDFFYPYQRQGFKAKLYTKKLCSFSF